MKKPISRFYLLLVLVPLLLLASMGGYYFLEETAADTKVAVEKLKNTILLESEEPNEKK